MGQPRGANQPAKQNQGPPEPRSTRERRERPHPRQTGLEEPRPKSDIYDLGRSEPIMRANIHTRGHPVICFKTGDPLGGPLFCLAAQPSLALADDALARAAGAPRQPLPHASFTFPVDVLARVAAWVVETQTALAAATGADPAGSRARSRPELTPPVVHGGGLARLPRPTLRTRVREREGGACGAAAPAVHGGGRQSLLLAERVGPNESIPFPDRS